jgi:transposase
MRGHPQNQINVACLIDVEAMIPPAHRIRVIKTLLGEVLRQLDGRFTAMYADEGRPSIPPERRLLAKVLMALYTIRSERQFCERLQYDLLFRWFLDLNPDEAVFDHSSFSANQRRRLAHAVADEFFAAAVQLAQARGWVSDQHFSVDGTLIEAWASLKSFRPKADPGGPGDGNGWVDFRGQERKNDTHGSTTDAEAKLARKGDGRLGVKVRSPAYALSQKCRRRIEAIFGWAKTTGGLRKSRYRGVARTHAAAQYVAAAGNLVRMAKMALGPPPLRARAGACPPI